MVTTKWSVALPASSTNVCTYLRLATALRSDTQGAFRVLGNKDAVEQYGSSFVHLVENKTVYLYLKWNERRAFLNHDCMPN